MIPIYLFPRHGDSSTESPLSSNSARWEICLFLSEKAEYYSIPSHVHRLIYQLLAAPTIPHKFPVQKLNRGERMPEPYNSVVKVFAAREQWPCQWLAGGPDTEQSPAAPPGWPHNTTTEGTRQHRTGISFWKHHQLSGSVRRNTVNKKTAFFFEFILLSQVDDNRWGSIWGTSTAACPSCLPPTIDCKR